MKYTIDTIPVWDAYKAGAICPLCHIERHLRDNCLELYLGDSVMSSDVRIDVNNKGFCKEHFVELYAYKTAKLTLALYAHTHMQQVLADFERLSAPVLDSCAHPSLPRRARNTAAKKRALDALGAHIQKQTDSCPICERIDTNMRRYYETIEMMWRKEKEFVALFATSEAPCLPHFAQMLQGLGGLDLSPQRDAFITALVEKQKSALHAIEQDLKWFTQKHDYRNADKPWGDSRTALPRAINRLHRQSIEVAED